MPSDFPIYFMSMHLSIQFAAICLRPPYEPFTLHKTWFLKLGELPPV